MNKNDLRTWKQKTKPGQNWVFTVCPFFRIENKAKKKSILFDVNMMIKTNARLDLKLSLFKMKEIFYIFYIFF